MTDGFQLHAIGVGETATALRALGGQAKQVMGAAVIRNTLALEALVKANASGRPGPNVRTGQYRRSIAHQLTMVTGEAAAGEVGTNALQGRRLELGFHGVDSLGRHYNQPPYPHFGPAAAAIEPAFQADIERLLAVWLGGA